MTTYYLMPNQPGADACKFDHAKIKLVEGRKNSELASEAYERELNGGKTWNEIMREIEVSEDRTKRAELLEQIKTAWHVVNIPYSQARDYRSFDEWECNKELA